MNLNFSRLTDTDLSACAELFVETFALEPWNEHWALEDALERLGDFLVAPKALAIKAETGGKLCGFALGNIQRGNGASYFGLRELCVAGEWQRRGVGRQLMMHLEASLAEKAVARIYLVTRSESGPSRFYTAMGFSENSELICMGKTLGWAG